MMEERFQLENNQIGVLSICQNSKGINMDVIISGICKKNIEIVFKESVIIKLTEGRCVSLSQDLVSYDSESHIVNLVGDEGGGFRVKFRGELICIPFLKKPGEAVCVVLTMYMERFILDISAITKDNVYLNFLSSELDIDDEVIVDVDFLEWASVPIKKD